jgi:NADPH:quinone reductase
LDDPQPNGYGLAVLTLHSLIDQTGLLTLSLGETEQPSPGPDEVVIKVEATPINPSDLGALIAGVDLASLTSSGDVTVGQLAADDLNAVAARIGVSMPVGNEAGGTVVQAGTSPAAQALLGKVVGVAGGAMYTQFRAVPAAACIVMPDGVTPEQAASCFVNPLTALGMVDTMRHDGHTALVHTAAASNLGQMLNRICLADGVGLVNVVRKPEQASLLRSQGAQYVCDSSSPSFRADLVAALQVTGATVAFDATGGGRLGGDILSAMEAALTEGKPYSRYGSTTHKQLYIYGGLDTSPTVLHRSYGMAWGIGGWLLTPFLMSSPPERVAELRSRVANEITTTFASHYSSRISLHEAIQPDTIRAYAAKATGQKYLITP